ncbi:hypothetical protein [Noviherbaspirillum sedimenti]|nr:hypothetical protein [Noviherbaspirillum sedimenti]
MTSIIDPSREVLSRVVSLDTPEPASGDRQQGRECRSEYLPAGAVSTSAPFALAPPLTGACAPSVDQVRAAAVALGVDATRFARYAALRWGRGWRRNATDRALALDEIRRYRNDAEGFADKVDTVGRSAGRIGGD